MGVRTFWAKMGKMDQNDQRSANHGENMPKIVGKLEKIETK